jgi:glutaredoxin
MLKKHQSLILIILLIVVVWLALTSRGNSNVVDLGRSPILFYSTTCPHCKNVEEYLTKNKVKTKIKIEELDVSQAPNAEKYQQAIEACQVPSDKAGSVPLLYAEGKCYFGDVDVINYFKEKLK